MRALLRVEPYPWAALDRLERRAVRLAHVLRWQLGRLELPRVASALGEVLGARFELVLQDLELGNVPQLGVELAFQSSGARFSVALDPALAGEVTGRLLGRPAPIAAPGAPLDVALAATLSAWLVEGVRRAGLNLEPARPGALSGELVVLRCVALCDDQPFSAAVCAAPAKLPTGARPRPDLAQLAERLGGTPLSLPLLGALCSVSRSDWDALEPGDALLPGAGWLLSGPERGRAVFAAPLAERGLGVEFSDAGEIVLRGDPVALPASLEMSDESVESADSASHPVLDAPILVRVEVGTLSLTAREWTELRPGDVLETGVRIAEPVVLRVAGREVARGELVDVEGELGVRILSFTTPPATGPGVP